MINKIIVFENINIPSLIIFIINYLLNIENINFGNWNKCIDFFDPIHWGNDKVI